MKSLNFNRTVCKVCSRFCDDGLEVCSEKCNTAEPCSTDKCPFKAFKNGQCQYCFQNAKRTRCRVCQRRVSKTIQCSQVCENAPLCACGNQVWVDFEEVYAQKCLNCLYHIHDVDDAYGVPDHIYILVIVDEHILVHKRGQTIPNPGRISVVSGKVESGETSRAAANREMVEEAGFDISGYALMRISKHAYALELPSSMRTFPFAPKPEFAYEVNPDFGYQWIPLACITPVSPYVKRLVKAYRRYKKYTTQEHRKLKFFIGFPNTTLMSDCPKIETSADRLVAAVRHLDLSFC